MLVNEFEAVQARLGSFGWDKEANFAAPMKNRRPILFRKKLHLNNSCYLFSQIDERKKNKNYKMKLKKKKE